MQILKKSRVVYEVLKEQEHHDLTEVFMKESGNFLTECYEIMHYPHDVSNANKEQLADFLANIMLNERDYAYYEDNILFTYKYLLENAFDSYCGNDLEKLAMIYYEEYGEIYYEGTLEELTEEIQLFIKLTE